MHGFFKIGGQGFGTFRFCSYSFSAFAPVFHRSSSLNDRSSRPLRAAAHIFQRVHDGFGMVERKPAAVNGRDLLYLPGGEVTTGAGLAAA